MSEFMKIGGKYTDPLGEETAQGIAVDATGQLKVTTVRHNETEKITICSELEKRDTANVAFTGDNAIDLSEWTTCSILVSNTLDVDAKIRLYTQDTKSGSAYLKYYDGSTAYIDLPHMSTGGYMITPDDCPILNYLRYFKGRIEFPNAPTSGKITVEVLRKR